MLANYQKNILKILEIQFGVQNEPHPRSFLLPDGRFLKTDVDEWNKNELGGTAYRPHYTLDNFIGNCVFDYLNKSWERYRWDDEEEKKQKEEKYGLTEKDFQEIYENVDWDNVGDEYGCPILEEMGCIRLNGYEEHYVVIPDKEYVDHLTPYQTTALADWLDKFATWNNKKIISVMTNDDNSFDWQEVGYPTDDIDYIIKRIRFYYGTGKLLEDMKETLTEATRSQVLSKSKSGKGYKDKTKGSRWTRKAKCKVSSNVKDYNRIDMDTFWKKDLLSFKISVVGETATYLVTIEFNNILHNIQAEVKNAKNKFDRDIVLRALMTSINNGQIKYDCTCDDFKYRLAYQASKNGYKAGEQETRPSDDTNPDDALGAACKHILFALNNSSWLRNIASVIVNYANYCKDNMEYNYSRYIFPKIFNMDYKKAVEACADDFDENGTLKTNLKSDEATINLANAIGKIRGRIKPGTNRNPVAQQK